MLPLAQLPEPPPEVRFAASRSGNRILIAGQRLSGGWQWQGQRDDQPDELWLPLDLLEGQLGFSRLENGNLEWYGEQRPLESIPQRPLGDEVALEVADWLGAVGVRSSTRGRQLLLELPAPLLQRLRRGKGSNAGRVVFDLDGPVFVQRLGSDLLLDFRSNPGQQRLLRTLGLQPRQTENGLRLQGQATRLSTLTLADPWRVVLDGLGEPAAEAVRAQQQTPLPLSHPAVAGLVRRGLVLERRQVTVGVKPLEVLRAGGDLPNLGLKLKPLTMVGSQQGLRFLPQLTRPAGAVIGVNGGYFNRIRQLPLGALRRNGVWLSGPILNRGVIAWNQNSALQFGRLRLDQDLVVNGGRRWGLGYLNSGYVQKGLSRYTRAWGPVYRALSGEEQALLVRDGIVETLYASAALRRGVPLAAQTDLVVARGGARLPAQPGDRVTLRLRANSMLGESSNVLGGGPLLLQEGRVVLNGRGEGFSPGFLSLSAPRTVVGSGEGGTWLLTLRGSTGSDPTLLETTLAMQQLGLRDALNLDGGSSTTMDVAGRSLMNGRGSSPRIHNGLGLVPG
ncbi:phosphodiester glycosidase family protein [Synechococcus sp. A15-127]|uniref:phosphodiester glycosidase family protein n=1 Tax=Synechococcus sp. A15-127 TaxID=1050624 RepID=UPI0016464A7C|nr:phosphodiester glycosidase family protein [Synechococcus sp. A15-127]